MIVPSNLKGVKPSNSTIGGGVPGASQMLNGNTNNPATMNGQSVSSILQNLRTPQGNPNNMLSPLQHAPHNKNKDVGGSPGIFLGNSGNSPLSG